MRGGGAETLARGPAPAAWQAPGLTRQTRRPRTACGRARPRGAAASAERSGCTRRPPPARAPARIAGLRVRVSTSQMRFGNLIIKAPGICNSLSTQAHRPDLVVEQMRTEVPGRPSGHECKYNEETLLALHTSSKQACTSDGSDRDMVYAFCTHPISPRLQHPGSRHGAPGW